MSVQEDTKTKVKLEPLELPYLFEKEIVEKQNKRIYVVEKFLPGLKVTPLTIKFYSKYDCVGSSGKNCHSKYLKIVDSRMQIPSDKFEQPLLESHKYGWTPGPMFRAYPNDFYFSSHAKIRTDLTIFGEKLNCQRITQRPTFNGLRFHLR